MRESRSRALPSSSTVRLTQRDPDLVRLAHRVGELEVVAEIVEQLALRARCASATGIRVARGCRR